MAEEKNCTVLSSARNLTVLVDGCVWSKYIPSEEAAQLGPTLLIPLVRHPQEKCPGNVSQGTLYALLDLHVLM